VIDSFQMLAGWCGPAVVPLGGGLVAGLFLAGAAGSVMHCAPMCGGFVLGQVADRMARLPAARLCERQRIGAGLLLPYHCGRLTTYAALGALVGLAGAGIAQLPAVGFLSAGLLLLAAVLFACHALRRLVPALRHVLPAADRAPAGWVRLVGRLTGRLDRTGWEGGYLLGVALGFLPCGFLYAALAAAAASASAPGGAVAMLAFGLGTVPALVVVGIAGQTAGQRWQRGMAVIAPLVMLANAALLLLLASQRLLA
jgi:sulfite exporter TauE/SafE